jgi:hypothetical protein
MVDIAPRIEMTTRSSEIEKPALPIRWGRFLVGVMVTTQGSNFPATGALGLVGGQAREMTGEHPEASGVTRLPKRQIPRQRA